jgi:membrane associated rhomboid family serine protease
MSSLKNNLHSQIRLADTLQRLLIVNIAIFLVVRLVNAFSGLFLTPVFTFQEVSEWLAIPADPVTLLNKPWTVITYMFYHWDFMHILFNMLWLYWMGRILQEYLGSRKLLAVYIAGGLAGALFYVIAFNVFPLFSAALPSSFALGASASVLAITVAAATLLPDYPIQLLFFGNVPLKWIAAISILLDLISISGANAGGHIAHLGGAFFGFIYIRQLKKGNDLGRWITAIMDRFSGKRSRMKVTQKRRVKHDEEFNVHRKAKQDRMDDILDKISRSGYGSLTQEEKDFLFQISKEQE